MNTQLIADEQSYGYWLLLADDVVYLHENYQFHHGSVPSGCSAIGRVGDYQQQALWLAKVDDSEQLNLHGVGVRELMLLGHIELFELSGRAKQLLHFIETHNYCGRCGHRMRRVLDEWAMHCDACAHRDYPRYSPCVIVAVHSDDSLLLAAHHRHKKHTEQPMFTTIAGFVDAGERFEQAVVREVFEETGVRVDEAAVEYIDSQSWPFPHSLMAGFVVKTQPQPLRLQTSELYAADWFRVTQLPNLPPHGTIARRLIELVVARLTTH